MTLEHNIDYRAKKDGEAHNACFNYIQWLICHQLANSTSMNIYSMEVMTLTLHLDILFKQVLDCTLIHLGHYHCI